MDFAIPDIGGSIQYGFQAIGPQAPPMQNGTFTNNSGVSSLLSNIGNIGATTATTYIQQQADKLIRMPQPNQSPVVLIPQFTNMSSPVPSYLPTGIGGLSTQELLLFGGAILLIVLVALKG